MLNVKHLNLWIAAIKKADAIYMPSWQKKAKASENFRLVETFEALHACGNRACAAGHLALMPEFQAIGGSVHPGSGAPVIAQMIGLPAVMAWLYGVERVTKWHFKDRGPESYDLTVDSKKVRAIVTGQSHAGLGVTNWHTWAAKEAVAALKLLRDKRDCPLEEFKQLLETQVWAPKSQED